MKVVFMGTPDFAVASLNAIHESHHEVVGVITAVDKPAGRGRKLHSSAVKHYALEHGIHIMQPRNLKAAEFQEELASLKADIFVVVAFRMLPEAVWSMPSHGTFNVHASLLPQYRGAAPINWAVINGDEKTGVTTFFIDEQIDTGNIIDSIEIEIGPEDNAGVVHDKLMVTGAALCLQTVDRIADGEIETIVQKDMDPSTLKKAPKIFAEHRKIDWTKEAGDVLNLVRGMSPYPTATSILKLAEKEEQTVKIFEVSIQESDSLSPGETSTDGKSYADVGTGSNNLRILSIQVPGKRKMDIRDILNGNLIQDGAVFS